MRTRLGPDADQVDDGAELIDLRLVPAAAALWLGVLAGLTGSRGLIVGAGAAATAATVVGFAVLGRRVVGDGRAMDGGHAAKLAIVIALISLLAGLVVGSVRASAVKAGPVDELAKAGAVVAVDGVVTDDPTLRMPEVTDREPYVVGRLRIEQVTGRGSSTEVRTPVLIVSSDPEWAELLPGTRVATHGRLAPADGGELAAMLRIAEPPTVAGEAGAVSKATEPFRQGLRDAVGDLPDTARGLVPGLAIGDDSQLPLANRDDMRATGLTHLTAVSGVHVGIFLVAVLGLARWVGIRGYALPVVAIVAIIGFAVLVRPDPSVMRASTMGLISVLGLTMAGRKRALPALAAAVLVLLLMDPWLGRSIGFALSVLSTAGIVIFAGVWRDALPWLPRSWAEALTVPLAAQVTSIPVLVGFVSETSLASVPANILAAPAVAPATLLGVLTAVVSPVLPPVASALAWLASWPASWIALVAEHGAALPGAVLRWPGGISSVVISVGLVVLLVVLLPQLFRRPVLSVGVAAVALVVLVVAPAPGWPPRGWLVVGCPVGQGDAFVLNAGPRTAVVVDAGPDPVAVDRCLKELGVEHVPLLVLTHFHADHVDGVPGVLDGRRVDEVMVSPLPEPAEQAEYVKTWLAEAGVPATPAAVGEQRAIGSSLRLRVIWPARIIGAGEPASNDSSVVLDAVVDGVRVLLTGDIEPSAQQALHRAERGLRTDVLKVPHHGSKSQDPEFLTSLDASLAIIGVGADNRHGHPAPETVELLESSGSAVWSTSSDGALAVVRSGDVDLGITSRGSDVFAR